MNLLMFRFVIQTKTTTSQHNMSKQQTTLYFFKEVAILSHSDFVWIYLVKAQDICDDIQ